LGYAAERDNLVIIDYLIKKYPWMVNSQDDLNHTVFTLANKFSTVEFILEKFFSAIETQAINQTSMLSCQFLKLSSKLSALDAAFLVTCLYGNVETMGMIIEESFALKGYRRQTSKLNLHSKTHEHRNGFFLAALNSNYEILHYFIKKQPQITETTTDIYGIVFSKDINEITCPNIQTSDHYLSISEIDSISQNGALKQRNIVNKLRRSIHCVNNLDFSNSPAKPNNNFQKFKQFFEGTRQNHKTSLVNLSDNITTNNIQHQKLDLNDFDSLRNHIEPLNFEDFDEVQLKRKSMKADFDKRYSLTIDDSYETIIGKGGFGLLFKATDLKNGRKVAIKIEPGNLFNPRLLYEYKIYKLLGNIDGFPIAHFYSPYGRENRLVLDLLGKSLEQIFQENSRKYTLKDISKIAIQSISRIQSFHKKGFVHRDIKPDNILFGMGENENKLYLIDFGLAKKYLKNGQYSGGRL
jgi:predicted Ser/Thr protein kinase